MITINQLVFTYPANDKPALRINQLSIPSGSFCLVTGQSGSGKSTLLRLTNGLVPHFTGGTLSGSIRVAGLDPVQSGPALMSKKVGFVFQEAENQFVVDVVEDEIAYSMENAAVPRSEMRSRIDNILQQLDINSLRKRKLSTLSGGEAQRVALAAALVLNPALLVLDEPTSQLDPRAAQEVLALLDRLRTTYGLTILLAEHRLERVLPFADSMVHIQPDGSDCWFGSPQEIIPRSQLQPPVVQLGIKFRWQPIPLDVPAAAAYVHHKLMINPPPPVLKINTGHPVISVKNLIVTYPEHPVLKDISFEVYEGERVAIMGPNGAGKSTLLRALIGLIKPQAGSIALFDQSIHNRQTAEICRSVGFLPQDPNALLFSESVQKELEVTLQNHGLQPEENEILTLLNELLLNEKSAAYPRDLSTGERQRTALGAICITNPKIIILDEPTRGMDQLAKAALIRLLKQWNAKKRTIIVVTHDVEFAAEFATRTMILENGSVLADGQPARVMHDFPRYRTQVANLFPDTPWLTVEDVEL
jgi:energy-coupling factor transport system ATP-binding protein